MSKIRRRRTLLRPVKPASDFHVPRPRVLGSRTAQVLSSRPMKPEESVLFWTFQETKRGPLKMKDKCMGVSVTNSRELVPKTVSRRCTSYGSHVRLNPSILQSPFYGIPVFSFPPAPLQPPLRRTHLSRMAQKFASASLSRPPVFAMFSLSLGLLVYFSLSGGLLVKCTFEGRGASNTTKIPREDTQRERKKKKHEKTPRERKKKRKWRRVREKKKREILGLPPFDPPFGTLRPQPSGPSLLWAPTPRTQHTHTTHTHTTQTTHNTPTQHTHNAHTSKRKLAQVELGLNRISPSKTWPK